MGGSMPFTFCKTALRSIFTIGLIAHFSAPAAAFDGFLDLQCKFCEPIVKVVQHTGKTQKKGRHYFYRRYSRHYHYYHYQQQYWHRWHYGHRWHYWGYGYYGLPGRPTTTSGEGLSRCPRFVYM
jgi:hypothetical protein